MLLVTAGGALATYFVSRHNLHSSRNDRVAAAQQRISDALRRRAYYLEDIGDMVGVHDDADFPEFSRWAHVRGRNEGAIVSVEWIRRSPDGTLVPPHDEIHAMYNPTKRHTVEIHVYGKDLVDLRRKMWADDGTEKPLVSTKYLNC